MGVKTMLTLQRCLWVSLIAVALESAAAPAGPVVFWASDPIWPGETALVVGEGFGETPQVEIERLADGQVAEPGAGDFHWSGSPEKVEAWQPNDRSVKFAVPAIFLPGVFVYRIRGPNGVTEGLLNRPNLWWVQGDQGPQASPGGWVRAFGKNLSWTDDQVKRLAEQGKRPETVLVFQGPRTLRLPVEADPYTAKAFIPADTPPGEYRVTVHNGCGGDAAWSDPVVIRMEKPAAWPQVVFDVKQFGADGTGAKDDTAAVQAALAKAQRNGGGMVYFPRGRYQITGTLTIPRFTVLGGEKREWVNLLWPDMSNPPDALIRGTNSFALEDLTLYASNYRNVIVGDLGDQPDAGNVRLTRLRVRAVAYRGHLKPEEVDQRLRKSLELSTGGGDTLRLGGSNIEISDSDFYGSGRSFILGSATGALVRGNKFSNGRWGWYDIFNSQQVIVEHNEIVGADLMSTGGGLSCWPGKWPSRQQNVYFGHNMFHNMHGWDREAITSDGGGGLYLGRVAAVEGVKATLAAAPDLEGRNWTGAAIYIHDGRGQGQYRQIVSIDGPVVTLDRPWDVAPDNTSLVGITMLQRRYLIVGNEFADAGIAVQFYGISMEHVVAGNRSVRAGGYQAIGKLYSGSYDQPPDKNPAQQASWYSQFLDNEILEGNIYRSGANNALLEADSVIGVYGWPPTDDWPWPFNRAAIVRRNRLANNAHIHIGGSENQAPSVRDVVVENNVIANSSTGIRIDRATSGVLLRGNRFDQVQVPLTGTGAGNAETK